MQAYSRADRSRFGVPFLGLLKKLRFETETGESLAAGARVAGGAGGLGAVQSKDCSWHSSSTARGVITVSGVIYWCFGVGKRLQVFGSKPGEGEKERDS